MRTASLVVAMGLCFAAATAHGQASDDARRAPVQIVWDQKIPMRDGVKLSATIYRDPRQTKKLPVIAMFTPYVADEVAVTAAYFAQRGYVFAAIDLRGRGNSDGVFLPGQSEGRDGFDAVEWLAQQAWSDGQVATWGGSWRGFAQWSLAKELPPHLRTMVPTAAVYLGVDFPFTAGVTSTYMLQWLAYVHGRALNKQLFSVDAVWDRVSEQQVTTGRAFQDIDAISGVSGTVFRTWLAHPTEDAFWQAVEPTAQQYAQLKIPILTITGHFDADQQGALAYYERHMAHGARDVTPRHWLVIGPWDHGGTREPVAELGGVKFGPDAVVDINDLHRAWYDFVLKGGPRPAFLKDRVACFLAGRNTWLYAPSLARIEGAPLTLALDVTGAVAGDVVHGGQLAGKPPTSRAQVSVISDPRYLPPPDETENPQWLRDQRADFDARADHVVLHSAPFAAETVLSGRPRIHLLVAVDQPDADVFVTLAEILPDGSAVQLGAGALRLRYRKGSTPVLMTRGKPELITIPNMPFFARAIAKGSRLRLSLQTGPRLSIERNPNTGGDPASEPLSKARIARLTFFTGPGTGSAIELPRPDESVLHKTEIAGGAHAP
ncbi:MAG TPA: CocE/NonD family hydrolase [Kofleriaceae bacterium]|nr:CocE/NonD family hydrolase [Kofleriaceae bacterium]